MGGRLNFYDNFPGNYYFFSSFPELKHEKEKTPVKINFILTHNKN